MQEGEDMLLIDSDVFIIDRRYRKDAKYRTNKNFLDFVHEEEKYTTVLNC
jgi:protein involved in polysaccharide export with SLBB domain